MSLIIGDAVDVQTLLRPALLPRDIRCAKLPNSHLEQKNSTERRVEMSCVVLSRAWSALNGLKSHDWSSCDHCSHLCVGLSHLYSV